jgi:hypothetical protein
MTLEKQGSKAGCGNRKQAIPLNKKSQRSYLRLFMVDFSGILCHEAAGSAYYEQSKRIINVNRQDKVGG